MTDFRPEYITIHPTEYSLRSQIRRDVRKNYIISGYANIIYMDFLNDIFKFSKLSERSEKLLTGSAKFLLVKYIIGEYEKNMVFLNREADS